MELPAIDVRSARTNDRIYRLVVWCGTIDPESAYSILEADTTVDQPANGRSLFDLRKAVVALDYAKANALAIKVERLRRPVRDRVAFLVETDLSYGLARQYSAVADHQFREARVFRSYDTACEWLGDASGIFLALEKNLEAIDWRDWSSQT